MKKRRNRGKEKNRNGLREGGRTGGMGNGEYEKETDKRGRNKRKEDVEGGLKADE